MSSYHSHSEPLTDEFTNPSASAVITTPSQRQQTGLGITVNTRSPPPPSNSFTQPTTNNYDPSTPTTVDSRANSRSSPLPSISQFPTSTSTYPHPHPHPKPSTITTSAEVGHTGITRRRQSVSTNLTSNTINDKEKEKEKDKHKTPTASSLGLGWIRGHRPSITSLSTAAATGSGSTPGPSKASRSDDEIYPDPDVDVDGVQRKARDRKRARRPTATAAVTPSFPQWDWRMPGVTQHMKNGEMSIDRSPGINIAPAQHPHLNSASTSRTPIASHTSLSFTLQPLAQDPNNILPLSLPPTPLGSPPISRAQTPLHSTYFPAQDLAAEDATSIPLASGSSSSPRTSISTSSSRFGWGGGNRSDSRSSADDEDIPSFPTSTSSSRNHHRSWWPKTHRSDSPISPKISTGFRTSTAPRLVRISSAVNGIIPIGMRRWSWLMDLATNPFGYRSNTSPRKTVIAKQRNREREKLTNGPGRKKTNQTVLGSRRIARAMYFVPTTLWSISIFVVSFATFAIVLTFTLKHILNPDKVPLPWQQYCTSSYPTLYSLQDPSLPLGYIDIESENNPTYTPYGDINPLPVNSFAPSSAKPLTLMPLSSSHAAWPYHPHHAPPFSPEMDIRVLDEALEPVGILIGVFTTDAGEERRNMIRQSYASHWRSRRDGTEGVRIRFVMGKPRKRFERAVQLEMEAFNDILLLDMPENMNSGKTHAFFSWAAANATVPDWEYPSHARGSDAALVPVWRGEKPPAYVVKADEDSFIMLGELEKRLRVIPRTKAYWGYLVKNTFMAGQCYALSFDLVQYIGASPALRTMKRGKEDKLVAKWMNMHPEREKIVWATERCWIYDHPKAGTVYSHGFLYPSTVEQVRLENQTGLSSHTLSMRGGLDASQSYSTVSKFGVRYRPISEDMTTVEQVEALIEGSPLSQLSSTSSSSSITREKIEKAMNGRPTRKERFLGDQEERGGTVVVHYIKKSEWFKETMIALLGDRDEQQTWHKGVGVGLSALEKRKGRIVEDTARGGEGGV